MVGLSSQNIRAWGLTTMWANRKTINIVARPLDIYILTNLPLAQRHSVIDIY